MWWRFIVFCFLVSFILFVVLNYLHDRPVVHFRFFKRGDDDQIVYERFKDNFLKERLVAFEFEDDNGTFVPEDVDIDEIITLMRGRLNVHDPNARKIAEDVNDYLTVTNYNELNTPSFKVNHEKIEKDLEYTDEVDEKQSEINNLKDYKLNVTKNVHEIPVFKDEADDIKKNNELLIQEIVDPSNMDHINKNEQNNVEQSLTIEVSNENKKKTSFSGFEETMDFKFITTTEQWENDLISPTLTTENNN